MIKKSNKFTPFIVYHYCYFKQNGTFSNVLKVNIRAIEDNILIFFNLTLRLIQPKPSLNNTQKIANIHP